MNLLQKISKLFRTGNPSGDVLDVFPFLRFIMPGLAGYRERKSGTESGQKFLRVSKCKSEYKRTVDEEENHLDATQYFIELVIGSTCLGHHHYAHRRELETILLITT
jgi:hypothetical protein